MVHIVVVDDHPVMLVGIREALRFAPDIQVVGQACDARSAVAEAVAKSPHVALVDLGLPAIDGVEAAELLSEAVPGLRILLLSEHFSSFAVERALRIHPAGLLLKSEAPERLAECIRLVMEGEQVFSSSDECRGIQRRAGHAAHCPGHPARAKDPLALVGTPHPQRLASSSPPHRSWSSPHRLLTASASPPLQRLTQLPLSVTIGAVSARIRKRPCLPL